MKAAIKSIVILTIILSNVIFLRVLSAQETARWSQQYQEAIHLFDRGFYNSAASELNNILKKNEDILPVYQSEIEGYLTLISIEERLEDMHERYLRMENLFAESSLMPYIRLRYATALSREGKFTEALGVLLKTEPKHLPRSYSAQLSFEKGLAAFYGGNTSQAKTFFESVTRLPHNKLTDPAYYYLAYSNYITSDFKEAILLFGRIKDNPNYSLLSSYYMLESRFMLNDYKYVTENGEELYDNLTGELKTKTARILSEAYYALENNQKARFYFERYSLTETSLTRKDIYFAGMLSYRQDKFDEAIELFKQVLEENDTLSQNASYYLGECYVETKNKIEAHKSFRNAAASDFDPVIKEDAMFNYAKLTFDLYSDISAFETYMEQFTPSVNKYNEIQNYIASSFLLNQNYKSAIEILQNIKSPTSRDVVNLQKASFLRGIQLIELGAYRDAIPILEISLKNGSYNREILNITKFWLAEAYFRNNQFNKSIELNLELVSPVSTFINSREYTTTAYNLAYGYFKTKDYSKAEEWFKKYINSSRGDIGYAAEAYTRLGDCLFMQKKYKESITAFSLVTESYKSLHNYALFQKSIAKGLIGEEIQKTEILQELLSKKPARALYAEALYELGRTLVQTGRNNEAVKYFTELNNTFTNSPYHAKALLELGLVHLNKGDNSKATEYYKTILKEAPESPESQDAIAGLENIYGDAGKADEFLTYLDGLGLSETRSASERESLLFNAAEKEFISGNYSSSVISLSSFLSKYPQGEKSAQAWFYLGESYHKTGKPDQALDAFMKVMDIGEGSFTELATLSYARISYNLENYNSAAKAYSSLKRIARLENNILEAQTGLMNSYYMDMQYKNAIAEATVALSMDISKDQNRRAEYIIGKSHYLKGERETAMKYLRKLSKDKISPEGAESTYLIISNAFDKGEFSTVEEEVYSFSESGTPHKYWLARSFILLGDSFAERENWAQAEATYKSIMDSYASETKDDIKEQIKMRLSKLEEINNERDNETL